MAASTSGRQTLPPGPTLPKSSMQYCTMHGITTQAHATWCIALHIPDSTEVQCVCVRVVTVFQHGEHQRVTLILDLTIFLGMGFHFFPWRLLA